MQARPSKLLLLQISYVDLDIRSTIDLALNPHKINAGAIESALAAKKYSLQIDPSETTETEIERLINLPNARKNVLVAVKYDPDDHHIISYKTENLDAESPKRFIILNEEITSKLASVKRDNIYEPSSSQSPTFFSSSTRMSKNRDEQSLLFLRGEYFNYAKMLEEMFRQDNKVKFLVRESSVEGLIAVERIEFDFSNENEPRAIIIPSRWIYNTNQGWREIPLVDNPKKRIPGDIEITKNNFHQYSEKLFDELDRKFGLEEENLLKPNHKKIDAVNIYKKEKPENNLFLRNEYKNFRMLLNEMVKQDNRVKFLVRESSIEGLIAVEQLQLNVSDKNNPKEEVTSSRWTYNTKQGWREIPLTEDPPKRIPGDIEITKNNFHQYSKKLFDELYRKFGLEEETLLKPNHEKIDAVGLKNIPRPFLRK